jgi:hypothetical protein
MIPQRTKDALRAAKTRGVILGNAKQAEANRSDADAFAESLRPIVAPFIHLSSRRIAKVLNDRGIKSPTGKAWQSDHRAALGGTLEGRKPPMTFYVYKATGRLSKNVWEMVSELDNYDAAVAAAEKLCPRSRKIETEPGNGLPKAYFGRDYGDRWKAMISKRRIFR